MTARGASFTIQSQQFPKAAGKKNRGRSERGETMIRLEHVNKFFGELHVLKDVNLTVAEGEKLVIIGPSGSGKSTTVRCMNFLE